MIPRSWIIAGMAAVVPLSVFGTWLTTSRYIHRAWDAERAQASLDAVTEARRIEQERAAKAAADDETTRNKDAEYAQNLAAANAAAGDAAADYGKQLRALQGRVARCTASAEATNPGEPTGSPAGGASGLSEEIGRDLAEVGRAANELAALVRDVCVPFAASVGR